MTYKKPGTPGLFPDWRTDMKKTLDANQLKLVAIFAMTVDHIAWLLFPGYAKGALRS